MQPSIGLLSAVAPIGPGHIIHIGKGGEPTVKGLVKLFKKAGCVSDTNISILRNNENQRVSEPKRQR